MMRRLIITCLCGSWALCNIPQEAQAIIGFKKEFEKLYINDETDKEFAKLIKSNKTGCYVCHQGKKRKNQNPYGKELEKLLDKKKDKKDKEKIIAALKKVEKIHTDPKDKKSPTYGDLIKANKLPGGPLEEVKKEPKKEGEDKEEESGGSSKESSEIEE